MMDQFQGRETSLEMTSVPEENDETLSLVGPRHRSLPGVTPDGSPLIKGLFDKEAGIYEGGQGAKVGLNQDGTPARGQNPF
jgi:hypothetical protein